ncbi:TPA: thermonuclease family protein [Escherichia coli]
MRIFLSVILFLFTAFQSANAGGIPGALAGILSTLNLEIQGKVIRVLDGDTIEIKTLPAKIVVYEVPIRVRLINIDAPEKKQPFGRWSTSQLKTLVAGKQVTVSYSHKDRYGRIIGHVFTTNGTDASRFMVQSGAAWVYSKRTRKQTSGHKVTMSHENLQRKDDVKTSTDLLCKANIMMR